ncbi:hypothetical protein [Saccharicrinis sp. FJH54]|uniref:hypothetical protein n=1 Tax=Saccharicrinis sp. FJH54 TaxID=3344665 RepID=UPI0035D41AE3
MINVKYIQKIPLNYLDNLDIQFNIEQFEKELLDLNYDVVKNDHTLIFKNSEVIHSHWIKRSLPWGKIHFSKDEKNLIIDFNSKIIGAIIVGLIISIIAILTNALPLIILGLLPIVTTYYSRRERIKKLIIKTYSRKERKYSNDNLVQKMPMYFIYIILAIIFSLIGLLNK